MVAQAAFAQPHGNEVILLPSVQAALLTGAAVVGDAARESIRQILWKLPQSEWRTDCVGSAGATPLFLLPTTELLMLGTHWQQYLPPLSERRYQENTRGG